ncbi:MAG TPA: DUF1573 domain-containing protein [Thermoanaerobaculales bacterium]|nr:DUF1573 domain-containing protein [Thermoanaerobaculales bacterium]
MRQTTSRLVAAAACCLLAGAVAAQAAGPKMVVPEKVKDTGTVAQGAVVDISFAISNEGTEPLQIKAVRPTCGCTVADYDKEIAPGGSGAVKAKLDTKDFSGPISKSILIMTNDPTEPTVSVVIKANVQPIVEVLPRPLIRFNAVQREPMTQKVVVVATDASRPFKVTKVESNVPFLTTAVRRLEGSELIADKPGDQYEVAVALADGAPVGPVSGTVTIVTDNPKAEQVPVKVYGVVRALLHVTPTQLEFGSVEAKARPGRNLIVVNNRTEGSVKVTGAAIDDPAFDASVATIEEGKRYQVTVTVKGDAAAGPRNATLTVKTTDRDFPELKVPVKASLR